MKQKKKSEVATGMTSDRKRRATNSRGAQRSRKRGNTTVVVSSSEARARQLVITTSQEPRTPLAAIKLFAGSMRARLLRGEAPAADWTTALSHICAATDEALTVIQNRLSLEPVVEPGGEQQ